MFYKPPRKVIKASLHQMDMQPGDLVQAKLRLYTQGKKIGIFHMVVEYYYCEQLYKVVVEALQNNVEVSYYSLDKEPNLVIEYVSELKIGEAIYLNDFLVI